MFKCGKLEPRDFSYPNWWNCRSNRNGPPDRTLIISKHVFYVIHTATGVVAPAVLSRYRSDRAHQYMVLARFPNTIDGVSFYPFTGAVRDHLYWCGGGAYRGYGWSDIAISLFESLRDARWWRYDLAANEETRKLPSLPQNLWLAAAIGLRNNGFDFIDYSPRGWHESNSRYRGKRASP